MGIKEILLKLLLNGLDMTFSDAPSHLYKTVCPSVRRAIGPLVRNALCRESGLFKELLL